MEAPGMQGEISCKHVSHHTNPIDGSFLSINIDAESGPANVALGCKPQNAIRALTPRISQINLVFPAAAAGKPYQENELVAGT